MWQVRFVIDFATGISDFKEKENNYEGGNLEFIVEAAYVHITSPT